MKLPAASHNNCFSNSLTKAERRAGFDRFFLAGAFFDFVFFLLAICGSFYSKRAIARAKITPVRRLGRGFSAAVFAPMFCVPITLAAPPAAITLPIAPQWQRASELCWAASGSIAVNFVSPPVNRNVDQPLEAAYRIFGLTRDALLDPATLPASTLALLPQQLACCNKDIELCNSGGEPILVGLDYVRIITPLSKRQIKRQLGTLKRPFIFSWKFKPNSDTERLIDHHYLIAFGYVDTGADGFFVKIWDPWPVPIAASAPPDIADVLPIPFETYRDPGKDMGMFSGYLETWKDLQPVDSQPSIPPSNAAECGPAVVDTINNRPDTNPIVLVRPASPSVSFERALADSLSPRQRARELKQIGRWVTVQEPLKVGMPFPIVTLEIDQLLDPRLDLPQLLARRTRVVLYPVTAGEHVVGSFLMVFDHGRWVGRGYANNETTRRLTQLRTSHAEHNHVQPEDFFLVSIPQRRAFFAAFQQGGRTELISTTTDRSIRVRENEAQPAEVVIANIIEAQRSEPR
jgi:hypothetical protein